MYAGVEWRMVEEGETERVCVCGVKYADEGNKCVNGLVYLSE